MVWILLLGGGAGDSAAVGMWIGIGVVGGSFGDGEVLVRASMQSKGLLALVSQRALNGSPKNRVPLPTRLYSAVGTNSSSSIVSPSPSSSFKKSSPPYSRPKPSVPRASAKYRPQELDEAARRRLTKRLYIPLPTAELRAWFIRSLLEKDWLFKLSEEDTNVICRMSEGYLGSDMKNLVKDASTGPLRDALRQGEIVKLQKEDLRTEIVKLQKEEDLRIVSIQIPMQTLGVLLMESGRRPLLMISAAGTCLGCFLAGLSLLLQGSQFPKELSPALALTGILVYTGSFSLGMGGLPWVLSSLGCSQVRHLIYNYTSEVFEEE
ncbi:ATPase family AAA domain-containing protein FIGL1-like [Papaver somniferum]|uniref:ATPase family AAA domain-containing protein FIGL1-like n=1 Tax=Papaver somniferum TaxID=3469 RepID=UPI000E6FFC8D|nr:ATPase family AAA domain-containing protein FIGL1-like [Papaver somniferum]